MSKLKVSIGVAAFNGEKTIRKMLDSILAQTLGDFEVIISDNASTDSTSEICQEYVKRDARISYYRQKTNIGSLKNYFFVLDKAKSEYFVWLSVDDWWSPTFLEKNVAILDSNDEIAGSISRMTYFDAEKIDQKPRRTSKIKKFYSYEEYPSPGIFENRIKFYLRLNKAENIYSVFRTDIIRKCRIIKRCAGWDLAIILAVLKHGEIRVLDEVLLYRSARGMSSRFEVEPFSLDNEYGLLGTIFPFLPFTFWILKNLGFRIFFKNFDYLLFLNCSATKYQIKHMGKRSGN